MSAASLLPLLVLLHPAMAGFAALLAVPLVIHLLNRRRYRTVPWAAMEFLLTAYQKRRKKLQVENLLLLLIRCAVPVVLALAFARPYFGADSALASLGQSQREVVVLLDDSYSMSRKNGSTTLHQAALEQVRRLAAGMKGERQDRVTLITFAREPTLHCVSAGLPDFERKLATLVRPQYERGDLKRVLDLLLQEVLDKQVLGQPEVWLFSDFQAITFDEALGELSGDAPPPTDAADGAQGSLAGRLRQLGARSSLHLVNVADGLPPPDDLAVVDLRANEPLAIRGQALRFTAEIRRSGRSGASSGSGRFRIGEVERPVTFPIDGDGKATVEVWHSCRDEGDVGVEFRVDEDDLADDDARFLRLPVKESLPILLVDGHPGGDLTEGAIASLLLIVDPNYGRDPEGGRRWFEPTVLPWYDLARVDVDFSKYEAVVFVDVREIDHERVLPALASYVESGGGALFLLGEELRPEAWNEHLFKGDGSGLLPLRIGAEPIGEAYDPSAGSARRDAPFRLEIADELHPAVRTFADDRRRGFLRFPIFRYWPFQAESGGVSALPSEARVVLRYEKSGAPALIEQRVGRGRTLWLNLSGIEDGWSNFTQAASAFFPLTWDMLNHLCVRDAGDHALPIGGAIARSFATPPLAWSITAPGGAARRGDAPREAVPGNWRLEPFTATTTPGLYALEAQFGGEALPLRELFAVNVDPLEARLDTLDGDAVRSLFDRIAFKYHGREVPVDSDEQQPERQGEIWKSLVLALLALLLLETVLACRFGTYSA